MEIIGRTAGNNGGRNKNHAQAHSERKINKRRLLRYGAAAVAGVLIYKGVTAIESTVGGLVPHPTTTATVNVNTALQKVELAQDTTIIIGHGTARSDISTTSKFGGIGIPFSGTDSGAALKSDLDIVSKSGAVTLKAVPLPGPNKGEWQTLASVNVNKLAAQLSNEQVTLTGGDQPLFSLMSALGLPNDRNGRQNTALVLAQHNFEASCAVPLTSAQVLAAAEASYIHSEIMSVAQATTNNSGVHNALMDLASHPILVEFVNPNQTVSQGEFVEPNNVHLSSLPKFYENRVIDDSNQTVNVNTSGNKCMLTDNAISELNNIKQSPGEVLLVQPYSGQ